MRWLPIIVRVFLCNAVVLFAVETLFYDESEKVVLVGSGVFGVWMTALLVGRAAYKLRARPDVELTNCQQASLLLPVGPTEVHDRAVAALQAVPAMISRDTGARIEARTGVSWSSWGETIIVELVTGNTVGPATAIIVQVRPRPRWAIVSEYGRSRAFADQVAHRLTWPVAAPQPTVSWAPSPGPALF